MNYSIHRRHFLRGTGAVIALPALESIGFQRFSSATENAAVERPKRALFLGFGWGVTEHSWYPDVTQTGADYSLPEGLKPMARHKKDFTVVQGCTNKFNDEGHWGSTFWLTGANRYSVPGQSFTNSISVDQVIARHIGRDTRFTSLQLSCDSAEARESGHGPGLSLAWDQKGKPIPGQNTALSLYHKLFSASDLPLEERRSAIAEKRSVLDAVHGQARKLLRRLSANDVEKLEEYFQGIRDIEIRLSKEEEWLTVPKAKPPFDLPSPDLKGLDEIRIMYKLIVAAFQTDSTRVISYRQPVQALLNSLDLNANAHSMSHYVKGNQNEVISKKRDLTQGQLLSGLFDELKATKEVDGTSLFDNLVLAYGSNIRASHYLDNCPTILAGGAANFKLGHHIVLPRDTPLCNVWLALQQGLGIEAERHGDSSGVAKSVLA